MISIMLYLVLYLRRVVRLFIIRDVFAGKITCIGLHVFNHVYGSARGH